MRRWAERADAEADLCRLSVTPHRLSSLVVWGSMTPSGHLATESGKAFREPRAVSLAAEGAASPLTEGHRGTTYATDGEMIVHGG